MIENGGELPGIAVALVAAVAENGIIGRGGQLPWRIPSDLKAFRRLTMGKPIIMGRRTYHSVGKALDGRDNIVVTGDKHFTAPGIYVVRGIEDALGLAKTLAQARGVSEIMVVGGAQVYRAAMPYVDRMYLTEVHASPGGDTILPAIVSSEWHEASREPLPRDPRDEFACTLRIIERVRRGPDQAPS